MIGVVYWEDDPVRERVVRYFCRRCQASLDKWEVNGRMKRVRDVDAVSPKGIGHAGGFAWQSDGRTACGIDGTGKDWWWSI